MIHPTALIDPQAKLGRDVEIGPYVIIDGPVQLGDGCKVGPHAFLTGHTRIGDGTVIHTGSVIGDVPQDLHYKGGVSYTRVGKNCIIREYVTIHRGSAEGSATEVGDNVMLMGFVHLGHNCKIGDGAIIANATLLAGHVEIGRRAFLSGGVLVHQFVRVGDMVMVRGGERFGQDVPPYCMLADGYIQGPNTVGLRRAGIPGDVRMKIREAIKILFRSGLPRPNALAVLRERFSGIPEIERFIEFVESTTRGLMPGRPKRWIAEPEADAADSAEHAGRTADA